MMLDITSLNRRDIVNIKISYEYGELLEEFYEDMAEGLLTKEDSVQILRGETRFTNVPTREELFIYTPIIDWYYDENTMNDFIANYSNGDDGEEDELTQEEVSRYLEDKPNLVTISVAELLEELNRMNEIF